MADDARSENALESSQARDALRPVVWTRIGRAWLETLTARAEAEDGAEAARSAAVAATEGAQDVSLLETPEIPNLNGTPQRRSGRRPAADSGGVTDTMEDAGDCHRP